MDQANLRRKLNYAAKWAAVFSAAAALKLFYSSAAVDDLRWILAPTAFLVEVTSGLEFYYEAHVGYMSADRTFLIALPCSGINLLIVAFLTLSLRWLLGDGATWRSLGLAVGISYLATIVANTARISVAIQLRDVAPSLDWMEPEELHRLEGIAVYFAALLLLFFVDERISSLGRRPFADRKAYSVRSYLLPLAIYHAVTLGIPLMNGAYRQGIEFWRHAVFVFLTPILLIAVISTVQIIAAHRTRLSLWRP